MAAKVNTVLNTFDSAYIVCRVLDELIEGSVALEIFVDCCTLLNLIAKNGSRAEKNIAERHICFENQLLARSDISSKRAYRRGGAVDMSRNEI